MKSIIRILIGVVLFYPAHRIHVASYKLSDKAIGIDWTERKPEDDRPPGVKRRPRPEDADFFGPDPREVIERPEIKKKLDEALDMDRQAVAVACVGGLFILWGLYPVLHAVFIWLLMPEWLKRQLAAASAAESKEVEIGKPEAPKRSGVDDGQGHSGNLRVPPATGGDQGRGGRNVPGGGVGA